jgi:hypothetical protein
MSGGSLEYKYFQLLSFAEDIDEKLQKGLDFSNSTLKEPEKALILLGIKSISKDLKKLSEYTKDLEWWLSGDTDASDFLKSTKKYNASKKIKPLKSRNKAKSKEELTVSIGGLFDSVKLLADAGLKESKPKVDYIIKNKIKDEKTIEFLLDNLMNLILAGADDKYFFKLLNYYKAFNEEGYNFLIKFYNEMTS